MKKYDIEKGFISKLIETGDILLVKEKQINSSYFNAENKRIFSFIEKYYLEHGSIPTERVLNIDFPYYKLERYTKENICGTEESLLHWCNEVRKKKKHNKIADIVESMAENLQSKDSEKAYELMKKGVLYIENEVEETSSVDITQDVESRKKMYLDKKKSKGLMGITTGIDSLDNITLGNEKETLTVIIAKTGIGKSFLTFLLGAYAQINGYRVLQFTTEMSTEMVRDRYEALLFSMIVGDFNYSRFKKGRLYPNEEEQYFEFLDTHLPRLEPLIIEQAIGVSSVSAKIDQYKPDLVLIDGIYLMEDERGSKEDWLRITHITRDLKILAKRKKLPIIGNSQADSQTSKKTGPELENIGYSKAIGQDADKIWALFQDDQMRTDKEMKIKVLKNREGTLGSITMNWDFTVMNFDSIYSNTEEKEENNSVSSSKEGVVEV